MKIIAKQKNNLFQRGNHHLTRRHHRQSSNENSPTPGKSHPRIPEKIVPISLIQIFILNYDRIIEITSLKESAK
jgi:hypothetical protein